MPAKSNPQVRESPEILVSDSGGLLGNGPLGYSPLVRVETGSINKMVAGLSDFDL